MSARRKLRVIISGAAWSFLGVVLTIAFFYVDQYRNPFDFRVYIDGDVGLVQVRERIRDLEIRYKGEDILNSGKEIRLLSITLDNQGTTILQQHYDGASPFGLAIEDAVILDAEVGESNSSYLKENILIASRANQENVSALDAPPVQPIRLPSYDRGQLHFG